MSDKRPAVENVRAAGSLLRAVLLLAGCIAGAGLVLPWLTAQVAPLRWL